MTDDAREWRELLEHGRKIAHERDLLVSTVLERHEHEHAEPAMWCTPACRLAHQLRW